MQTVWPSGLRRQFQVLVTCGVGSNPTTVRLIFFSLRSRNVKKRNVKKEKNDRWREPSFRRSLLFFSFRDVKEKTHVSLSFRVKRRFDRFFVPENFCRWTENRIFFGSTIKQERKSCRWKRFVFLRIWIESEIATVFAQLKANRSGENFLDENLLFSVEKIFLSKQSEEKNFDWIRVKNLFSNKSSNVESSASLKGFLFLRDVQTWNDGSFRIARKIFLRLFSAFFLTTRDFRLDFGQCFDNCLKTNVLLYFLCRFFDSTSLNSLENENKDQNFRFSPLSKIVEISPLEFPLRLVSFSFSSRKSTEENSLWKLSRLYDFIFLHTFLLRVFRNVSFELFSSRVFFNLKRENWIFEFSFQNRSDFHRWSNPWAT